MNAAQTPYTNAPAFRTPSPARQNLSSLNSWDSERLKSLTTVLLLLAISLIAASGCGSSNSTSEDAGEANTQLAELTADLPRDGYVLVTSADANATPTPTPSSSGSGGEDTIAPTQSQPSGGQLIMRRFLWKPVSESNGNVVVLVDPTNVEVVVSGNVSETLRDSGPSNGRGTTARGSRTGCEYGNGVTVSFFRNGRRVGFIDGQLTVRIGNGCDREEFDL